MRPRHGHAPRRPNIGITPDVTVPSDDRPQAYYELKVPYAEAVFKAGGLPMVLPYTDDPSAVDCYLDRISGLLVTGGAFDIPPEFYGEASKEGLGALKPKRSRFELLMMRAALKRRIPILGICGGMQLLHVAVGGTLFQDIRTEIANAKEHEQKHDRRQPHHPVEIREGTLLAEVMGKGALMVNSTHHQAANRLGDKEVVSATSPDSVIEAIEMPDHPFAVGVQWHPELLIHTVPAHLALYKAFVGKAREMRR